MSTSTVVPPVRRYLPMLIELVWNGRINPGKVFDLTLPLDQVAEGYRAMDERRPIKTLLRPCGARVLERSHAGGGGAQPIC
jgi:threonine dehydrogenase-like Zn-dependent dehydrogenase